MGNDIILCMALIASFAFVIQFLLSILGSDLDTDIDNASDLSMSLSDITRKDLKTMTYDGPGNAFAI